jgi:protein involved in polysaccharide export with SLBB domain
MERHPTRRHATGSVSAARLAVTGLILCGLFSGCAAITNPLANGIPVRILPDELLAESKKDLKPISLALLRQPYPKSYQLAAGDILGVYIEGVLGEADTPPPVQITEGTNLPPSIGYPIPVRQDGTVPMPLIDPVSVDGMTVAQAEKAIVAAYEAKKILRSEDRRVLVTLMRPRQTRVLVMREDSQNQYQRLTIRSRAIRGLPTTQTTIGGTQQGTGAVLELPAYENDVLHALADTGGLPGADAIEEVIIQRGYWDVAANPSGADIALPAGVDSANADQGQQTIRIPLRQRPGEPLPFTPRDILLQTGDIVVIRALEPAFYYTGGLMPAREVPMPRDTDLTVVEAILKVDGSLLNGAVSTDNLNGTIVQPGLGNPSPSLLAVLRKTPNNGQVTIRVDLNRAVKDPRENILVQAGDVLVLQETPCEAIGRYTSQVFNLNIITKIIDRGSAQGTTSVALP